MASANTYPIPIAHHVRGASARWSWRISRSTATGSSTALAGDVKGYFSLTGKPAGLTAKRGRHGTPRFSAVRGAIDRRPVRCSGEGFRSGPGAGADALCVGGGSGLCRSGDGLPRRLPPLLRAECIGAAARGAADRGDARGAAARGRMGRTAGAAGAPLLVGALDGRRGADHAPGRMSVAGQRRQLLDPSAAAAGLPRGGLAGSRRSFPSSRSASGSSPARSPEANSRCSPSRGRSWPARS